MRNLNETTFTKVYLPYKNIQTHFRLKTDCHIKIWKMYIFRDFYTSFIQIARKRNIILRLGVFVSDIINAKTKHFLAVLVMKIKIES